MIRFLTDENFNGKIVRGLRARNQLIDVLHWLDIGAEGEEDPVIMEWAAQQGRMVLTHDFDTMIGFAYERVEHGLAMPGVVAIPSETPFRPIIDDLQLIAEASHENEYAGQVIYLPL